MYMVPLQCFCTVTCSHVTALTVMALGTRTLQDTHRHSLTRLQHNASWLPEAMCHCSTELRRPSQVKSYRTDMFFTRLHLSAHIFRYFIISCTSVWWHTHTYIACIYHNACVVSFFKRRQNIYLYPRNVGWTQRSNAPLIIQTAAHIHAVGIKSYTAGPWQGLVEDSKIMSLHLVSE